jgi:signal transduction histidine kinase/CheY-like chemotaxis protein
MILGIAIAYYIIAKLSQFLAIPPGFVSPVYPPSGMALAVVLLIGPWATAGVWIGQVFAAGMAFLSNTGQVGPSVAVGMAIATGSTLQALAGGWAIRRWIPSLRLFNHAYSVFKFVGIETLACAIAPTFGVTAMFLLGLMDPADATNNWLTFWLGDLMGVLVLIPLVITWRQPSRQGQVPTTPAADRRGSQPRSQPTPGLRSILPRSPIEMLSWLAVLAIVSFGAFRLAYPLEYLLIPILVWAAFRFGSRGVAVAIALVSALAIAGAVGGTSSFNRATLNESLLLLQAFIGTVAVTTLVLAAVILEREAAEAELVGVNEGLEAIVAERTAELTASRDAAQVANQAKSSFLANMSHELRTPLNGVLGYAQILNRSPHLDPDTRAKVNTIHQCGSHLLMLINDVLDLSKIEAQKMELHLSEFHFPAFLSGVAEMSRIRAEQKDIAFQVELADELPEGVRGDEKRLRQVLLNLLGNAIKFTEVGGVTLTVRSGTEALQRDRIRFEIRDTGIGIPPDDLETIFNPFEQTQDGKRQTEGTGLGLAISQRIVELMGGQITVTSEPGVGSVFAFDVVLPTATEWMVAARSTSQGDIVGVQGTAPKILVVDDKWENRAVLRELLTPLGMVVLEAENGASGLEVAIAETPDLVITDLLMPVMDGFELIRQLRQHSELGDRPIVASSASVFDSDADASIQAGGTSFLPKPVQAEALLREIQKQLHLSWAYADPQARPPEPIAPTDWHLPPAAALATLESLVRSGNFKGIARWAQELGAQQAEYAAFAERVVVLAGEFSDREILDLIAQATPEPAS